MEIGKGNTATFTAMASGISTSENNFMYQWRKRDSNSLPNKVSGVNNSVLTIPNVIESDGGQYYCTVTNEWDRSIMSDEVSLSIFGMLQLFIYVLSYCYYLYVGLPRILDHPTGGEIPVGDNISFICGGNGTGPLEYSWERSSGSSWTTVSNDNTASYTTDTTLAIGQYMYRCRVSNDAGSAVSNNAIVNVYGEYCPNM